MPYKRLARYADTRLQLILRHAGQTERDYVSPVEVEIQAEECQVL